jgi:hypothetical protein
MARISECATCGSQTLDGRYCCEECAVAPLSDLLARIKRELQASDVHPLSAALCDEIVSGKWTKKEAFLEQLGKRRFQEHQAAAQERLDDLIEFEVAQKAVEKFRKGKGKKSKVRC